MDRLKWRDDLIRGDLVYVKLLEQVGSSVQSGMRPCVIVSNDISNRNAKIVNVCPLTSKNEKGNIPVHIKVEKNAQGVYLDKDSWILVEQIRTVDKSKLLSLVGHLDQESDVMRDVDRAMERQLRLDNIAEDD